VDGGAIADSSQWAASASADRVITATYWQLPRRPRMWAQVDSSVKSILRDGEPDFVAVGGAAKRRSDVS
jgi:hypothetical protein